MYGAPTFCDEILIAKLQSSASRSVWGTVEVFVADEDDAVSTTDLRTGPDGGIGGSADFRTPVASSAVFDDGAGAVVGSLSFDAIDVDDFASSLASASPSQCANPGM